jgi:hypothetical protein
MFQIGSNLFVRSLESDGWVSQCDLPPEKVAAMYARLERESAARRSA